MDMSFPLDPLVLSVGPSKRGRKKRTKYIDKCLVCGDRSVGINFGVYTCSPCKAFFRRNAVKLGFYEFICAKDGDCPITIDTRRLCNCCRLAKCFRVGMDRNVIRSADEKQQRNQLAVYNRQQRGANNAVQPLNLRTYPHSRCLSLSSDDQTLLTNIMHAYDRTCAALRYNTHLNMTNGETLSLEKLMNSTSHVYTALVDYIKLIPQFTNLPMQDKVLLMKNNLNQVFRLNSALIVHATGVADDLGPTVFKRLFPYELYQDLRRCILDLFPFVYDPILIKLLVVVLIFSTSLSVRFDASQRVAHMKKVLTVQNFYIELLWRYILYRCSTCRRSVQLLTMFITRLLHSQVVSEQLSEHIGSLSPTRVDQLEPIIKAMWLDGMQK